MRSRVPVLWCRPWGPQPWRPHQAGECGRRLRMAPERAWGLPPSSPPAPPPPADEAWPPATTETPERTTATTGGQRNISTGGHFPQARILEPQPRGRPPGPATGPSPHALPLTCSLNALSVTSFRLMSTLKYAPNTPVSRALAATCNRRQARGRRSVTPRMAGPLYPLCYAGPRLGALTPHQ